jgi:hypothetical protein
MKKPVGSAGFFFKWGNLRGGLDNLLLYFPGKDEIRQSPAKKGMYCIHRE